MLLVEGMGCWGRARAHLVHAVALRSSSASRGSTIWEHGLFVRLSSVDVLRCLRRSPRPPRPCRSTSLNTDSIAQRACPKPPPVVRLKGAPVYMSSQELAIVACHRAVPTAGVVLGMVLLSCWLVQLVSVPTGPSTHVRGRQRRLAWSANQPCRCLARPPCRQIPLSPHSIAVPVPPRGCEARVPRSIAVPVAPRGCEASVDHPSFSTAYCLLDSVFSSLLSSVPHGC